MSEYNLERLADELHHHVLCVKFVKADGTERTMRCTLVPSLLPSIPSEESVSDAVEHDRAVVVWDLELEDWRSFVPSRVTRVERIGDSF